MRGGFLCSLSPAFVKKSNPSFFIHALIHCLIHALIGGLDHAVIGCLIHAFMRCLIGLVWSYWNFPIGPRWYWLLLLASGAGVATSAVPYQRARFIAT